MSVTPDGQQADFFLQLLCWALVERGVGSRLYTGGRFGKGRVELFVEDDLQELEGAGRALQEESCDRFWRLKSFHGGYKPHAAT